MVSFFGLKIRGDKKRKPERTAGEKRAGLDPLDEDQFFNAGRPSAIDVGVRSVARDDGAPPAQTRFRPPYGAHNHAGASSLQDLSHDARVRADSYPELKNSSSEANLRLHHPNTSSGSLALSSPSSKPLPGTPGGARTAPWAGPLDVQPGGPVSAPKSALSQLELSSDLPDAEDGSGPLLGDSPIMGSVAQRKDPSELRKGSAAGRRIGAGADREPETQKELPAPPPQESPASPPPPRPGRGYPAPQPNGTANRARFQGPTDPHPGSRSGSGSNPVDELMDRLKYQGRADQRTPNPRVQRSNTEPEPTGRPRFPDQRPPSRGRPGNAPNEHSDRPVFRGQADQRPSSRGRPSANSTSGPAPTTSRTHGPHRQQDSGSVPLSRPAGTPLAANRGKMQPPEAPAASDSPPEQQQQQYPPRKGSLSTKIEELEKTLIDAQQAQDSSERHADGETGEWPQPNHPPQPALPFAIDRPQSPMRGPPRQGQGPRRPKLDEYNVPSGRMTPDARPRQDRAPPPRLDLFTKELPPILPASPTSPQQFSLPPPAGERGHLASVSHEKFTNPRPSPIPGPLQAAASLSSTKPPPTPDSSNWPLPSPIKTTVVSAPTTAQPNGHGSPKSPVSPKSPRSPRSPRTPGSSSSPGLARDNIPPPLHFNFSPNAYSRGHGPFTPPPRMNGERGRQASLDQRPGTAGNASVVPQADSPEQGLGLGIQHIGMARGASVREVGDRRPDHGLKSPTGIADDFGTRFI